MHHRIRAAERWVLAASILGSTMAFIDGTVVNVALPALQEGLGATAAEVQWVVEGYALSLSALLLLGGALGDRVGRRRVFAAGVALFALASVACGLSPDIHWLIAARVVQGIGGALLVPGSLALLSANFPPDRRGQAIGTWSAFSAAATGGGPVLGGWLIQTLSWRVIFWLNVPLAVATLIICWRRVPESRDPTAPARLDLIGAALATLGLGALIFGLIEGPPIRLPAPADPNRAHPGRRNIGALRRCRRTSAIPDGAPRPVQVSRVQRRQFADAPSVRRGRWRNVLSPLRPHSGSSLHASPGRGCAVAVRDPALSIVRDCGPHVRPVRRQDPVGRRSGDCRRRARPSHSARNDGELLDHLFPGITVLGLGMSVAVAPLTTTVMGSAGTERSGVASGINNAVSRAAGLLAVAALGVIASARFGSALDDRLQALRVPEHVQAQLSGVRAKLAGAPLPPGLSPEMRRRLREAVDGSFVEGFRAVMWVAALLAVGAGVVAWIFIRQTPGARKKA